MSKMLAQRYKKKMDSFSNQITDADKACRSSEISVDLIIIIVFLQTYSYFCYILTSFFDIVVLTFQRFIYLFCLFAHRIVNTCFRSDIPQVHMLATFSDIYIYIALKVRISTTVSYELSIRIDSNVTKFILVF